MLKTIQQRVEPILSSRLGNYQLLERVAEGGMAEIFLALRPDEEGNRLYAIKKIHSQHASQREFVEMFLDEGRILSKLKHPNLVRMYEVGRKGDDYFIVMEHLHGKDLNQIIKRQRKLQDHLPLDFVLSTFQQVAEGLHAAHTATNIAGQPLKVVHRDLSPHNLYVCFRGRAKVLDFGIASVRGKQHATQVGVVKGKLPYMSPEQCKGEQLDHRSDIFSLGSNLFEMLTLQRLYQGNNEFALLKAIVEGPIPKLSSLRPELPLCLEELLLTTLSKRAGTRFSTALEFAQAIKSCAQKMGIKLSRSVIQSQMDTMYGDERRAFELDIATRFSKGSLGKLDEYKKDDPAIHLTVKKSQENDFDWDEIVGRLDHEDKKIAARDNAIYDIINVLEEGKMSVSSNEVVDEMLVFSLSGSIDGTFSHITPASRAKSTLIFDLHDLRVFGPRTTMEFFRYLPTLTTEAVHVIGVSRFMLQQVTDIDHFERLSIDTFTTCFYCENCGNEAKHAVLCEDLEASKVCPFCGDDSLIDPTRPQPEVPTPHDIMSEELRVLLQDILASRESSRAKQSLEDSKTILEMHTLPHKVRRWNKYFSSLEGEVAIQFFGHAPNHKEKDVLRLADGLKSLKGVANVCIEGASIALAEFFNEHPEEHIQLYSMTLPIKDPKKGTYRYKILEMTKLLKLKPPKAIFADDRGENGELVFVEFERLRSWIAQGPKTPKSLKVEAPSTESSLDSHPKPSEEVMVTTQESSKPTPRSLPFLEENPSSEGKSQGQMKIIALLVVLLIVALIFSII